MTRLRLADVQRAREAVRRVLPPTPLRRSFAARGRDTWLKLECWQPTGSFKVRGALNVLAGLTPETAPAGVVAASAGNHALGVAFAAEALGVRFPVTLFVPGSAPRAKLDKLRRFPVQVEVVGRTYDDAQAAARRRMEETGAREVHAFDDPGTAAGQGTVALEILDQLPRVGTVVVPVGGGGLISGLAAVLGEAAPHVRVVAVQPAASPALRDSLVAGRPLLEYPAAPTLADGLAGGIGEMVWAHRHLLHEVVEVDEAAIEDAMVALLADDQVVAEASGAASVAAVRDGLATGPAPIVAVVTGGNVDVAVLARLLQGRR